jgi:uncharacterized protein YbjT (DUF2867 family)
MTAVFGVIAFPNAAYSLLLIINVVQPSLAGPAAARNGCATGAVEFMGELILVTGASGNVGREVMRALAERGVAARAAIPDPIGGRSPGEATNAVGTVDTVRFDFTDPSTFPAAFDGVERLFLVRPPAISAVERDIRPVIDFAAGRDVKQIVFLSLLGAERNRLIPHARIEKLLLASGVPWTMLRCGFFMQNLDTTHRADIVEYDDLFVPAGDSRTAFIDTRDIGAAAARALTEAGHEGRVYTLTGSEALTYGEVATIMSEELGRPITYSDPSPLAFARRMRRRGHPWGYIGVMEGVYLTTRLGLAATIAPDAARLLGRPPILMRQFVRDYAESFEPGQ